MSANERLSAYVLHTRRYGDSSLLLELFTREKGRIACIAKGILRAGSRRSERPQPFQSLSIGLRGRGDVQTLVDSEPDGHNVLLSGKTLYCGLYLNELILKLTAREDPLPALFDDYAQTIGTLGQGLPPEPALRRFEVRLLNHLGHGLILERDAQDHPIDPVKRYTYLIGTGPQVALGESKSVSGQTLLDLATGELTGTTANDGGLREARQLMRTVLNHYLDGRPLRSRELFR